MFTDQTIGDDAATDEMFLNDALEHRRIARAIPGTFRVHDRDRPALTDAQAVRLRTQDAALLGELELFEPTPEELPGRETTLFLAAFRLRLIAAEKEMTPCDRDADACGDFTLGISHSGKYSQRVFRTLIFTASVLAAGSAFAQFGHPLKGAWSGDWGPNQDQRTRVLLQMQWDGKAITGAINPGPNARPLTKASIDPQTWQVHLEARDIVIDGKLDNLGSAHRVLSGTWTEAGRKGDFRLIRN